MHQPSNNMAYKKFSNIIMYCYIRYLLICKSNTSLQFCWIKIVKHKKNGMPINNKTFYTFHKFRVLELEKNLGYQNNHKHVEREGNSVFLYLDCITRKCYFSVFLFYFISPSLYLYSTLMDAINLWVHFFNYVEQGRLLFLFLFTFTALDRNIQTRTNIHMLFTHSYIFLIFEEKHSYIFYPFTLSFYISRKVEDIGLYKT